MDWSAVASGAAGLIGVAANYQAVQDTNEANKNNVYETNKTNKEINQTNLDYNKAMTQLQWERDDNAHQREVADLEAAGLSPLANMSGSANGSPLGAPNPIPMESFKAQAPQLDTNSLVQSILKNKELDETKRHNEQNEKYQESSLNLQAEEIANKTRELDIRDEELKHKVEYDAQLIKLQSDQLDELKRHQKKEEELRLSEQEIRRLEEQSQRFAKEINQKSGGHNYREYNDFDTYYDAYRLWCVAYDNFLSEFGDTKSANASSTGRNYNVGGNASVSGAGTGFGLGANVGNGSTDSNYESHDISKKQEAKLEKFYREHPVPVYINKEDYKDLMKSRGK